MNVLLDENLPRKLAGYLTAHVCRTVAECGRAGKKNGELLALAETEFDVLLSLDKNVPYQQQISHRHIAILILRARSNRLEDLAPLVPDCLAALKGMTPGDVVRVGS